MARYQHADVFIGLCGLLCLCLGGCPPTSSNLAPQADDQSVIVPFNTSSAITLTASDPDDGPQALTFSIVSQPLHGTLTGTPPSVTYTPTTGYSGPDSLTFKANDAAADTNSATVSITVQAAGAGSGGATIKYRTYRGTFQLSWQQQSSQFGTQSSEASGTVEFGDPFDSEYGPGTGFGAIRANSPAQVSNWHSTDVNGGTATQIGGGTADVSWGNLYIPDSGQVAIELTVNGTLTELDCPPAPQDCFTRESASAFASFSGHGCPLVFVAAGPDLAQLEGTASETCSQTLAGITTTSIATLTWDLTGVE